MKFSSGVPVLPVFSGTQRAQAEVPGARLRVGNPQLGDISRSVHREEKACHRFLRKREHNKITVGVVTQIVAINTNLVTVFQNLTYLIHISGMSFRVRKAASRG